MSGKDSVFNGVDIEADYSVLSSTDEIASGSELVVVGDRSYSIGAHSLNNNFHSTGDKKYLEIKGLVENNINAIKSALLSNEVDSNYIDAIIDFAKNRDKNTTYLSSITESALDLGSPSPEVMAKVTASLFNVSYFRPEDIGEVTALSIYKLMHFLSGNGNDKDKNTIRHLLSDDYQVADNGVAKSFSASGFDMKAIRDIAQYNLVNTPPIMASFNADSNEVYLTLLCSSVDRLDVSIMFWSGQVKRRNPEIKLFVNCAIASAGVVDDVYLKFFSNAESGLDEAYRKQQSNTYAIDLFKECLTYACKTKCSDIHFTPGAKNLGLIRVRQDGVVRTLRVVGLNVITSILNNLFSSSGINTKPDSAPVPYEDLPPAVSERFSVRVQASKTVRGYGVVIRVLDNKSNTSEIESVGLDEIKDRLVKLTKTPHGLIIVTGPTGSGKTTTLYAMLKKINGLTNIIHTIENPAEYKCALWHQHQLSSDNEADGMAVFMKGLLRNDIDVGLIGEVRDRASAEKAIELASTGHLVFTTLHTNSAAKTITRISDMGVNMSSFSDVIKAIIAQRLVRKLCNNCKLIADKSLDSSVYDYLLKTIEKNELVDVDLSKKEIYKPNPCGCISCNYTGFLGRRPVYELMVVNEDVAVSIMNGDSGIEIAKKHMKFRERMIYRGLSLVINGVTSLDEVLSVVED